MSDIVAPKALRLTGCSDAQCYMVQKQTYMRRNVVFDGTFEDMKRFCEILYSMQSFPMDFERLIHGMRVYRIYACKTDVSIDVKHYEIREVLLFSLNKMFLRIGSFEYYMKILDYQIFLDKTEEIEEPLHQFYCALPLSVYWKRKSKEFILENVDTVTQLKLEEMRTLTVRFEVEPLVKLQLTQKDAESQVTGKKMRNVVRYFESRPHLDYGRYVEYYTDDVDSTQTWLHCRYVMRYLSFYANQPLMVEVRQDPMKLVKDNPQINCRRLEQVLVMDVRLRVPKEEGVYGVIFRLRSSDKQWIGYPFGFSFYVTKLLD